MTKQSSTKKLLGIDVDLFKKWIECQMIDHVKPIFMFEVIRDKN